MKTREQKRTEAMERQEAYNKLTREEKITKAVNAIGESRKELDKLGFKKKE